MAHRSLGRWSAIFCLLMTFGCSRNPSPAAPAAAAITVMQSVDLKVGNGNPIKAGQTAVVSYTGWLYEAAAAQTKGKKFDSSLDGGKPFSFALGTGNVIKGWDQGVDGMKIGGQRRLTIPPELGYGDQGAGGVIPPGATLVFDIELIDIK